MCDIGILLIPEKVQGERSIINEYVLKRDIRIVFTLSQGFLFHRQAFLYTIFTTFPIITGLLQAIWFQMVHGTFFYTIKSILN